MVHSTRAVHGIAAVVITLTFVLPSRTGAQKLPPVPKECNDIDEVATGTISAATFADITNEVPCFWVIVPQLRNKIIQSALQTVEKSVSTVQQGSTSGSSGTTSAVSKPSTPLASLASEYGGITSSTSNQTITLQTTLDGIPSALAGHGVVPYCWSPTVTIRGCVSGTKLQFLNRFGLGVTANTSTSSQTATGSASPPQGTTQQASLNSVANSGLSFSGASFKYAILRGKFTLPEKGPDPTPTENARARLDRAFMGPPNHADPASNPPNLQRDVWNEYAAWQSCIEKQFTTQNLYTSDKSERAKREEDYFDRYYLQIVGILFDGDQVDCSNNAKLPVFAGPGRLAGQSPQSELIAATENYMAAASIFEAQLGPMLDAAAGTALSFEYDYNTPTNQPTTSTLKLIGSRSFGSKIVCSKSKSNTDASASAAITRFTGTINLAGNLYNSDPSKVPGAGVFRAFQAGSELDTAFCTTKANWLESFFGNSTVGLTYYYQDQVSPSILKVTPGAPLSGINIVGLAPTTSQVFTKKGPISFVQVKYGLGVGKNVKFPIAFSWSNRTDLITHSLWSAQFGISYDFSSLLGSSSNSGTP